MFLPPVKQPWDADDTRYVRNAIIIGAAVALVTEVARGVVDVIKERATKRLEKLEAKKKESV